MIWMEILRRQVEQKGQSVVARELGYTPSTISQILASKYGAETSRVEERIMAVYGHKGLVDCPILGETAPSLCAENHDLARKIGLRTGNPDTARLYKRCQNCEVRK
jgi:hypothetical protein